MVYIGPMQLDQATAIAERVKAKADAEPEKGGVVCVGKYRLWKLADDALLIEHESGERIEVSEREIERFYNSRF